MSVDIHFFVEVERYGYWDVEAEFFLPGATDFMSLLSPHGIRGGDTAGLSTAGFPEYVSRKIVAKWGTWEYKDAGYPQNWGNVEPFKDKRLGKVYPHFGVFGEGWITLEGFDHLIKTYEAPPEYLSALYYMKGIAYEGINCRAVFFFDN